MYASGVKPLASTSASRLADVFQFHHVSHRDAALHHSQRVGFRPLKPESTEVDGRGVFGRHHMDLDAAAEWRHCAALVHADDLVAIDYAEGDRKSVV